MRMHIVSCFPVKIKKNNNNTSFILTQIKKERDITIIYLSYKDTSTVHIPVDNLYHSH